MRHSTILLASCVVIVAVAISTATLIVQRQIAMSGSHPYENRGQITDAERLRRSLAGEPLQAAALRNLALRSPNRQGLLRLSEKVSRRDPVTQVLLLDEGGPSGPLAAKLRHHDILLSIAPQTGTALLRPLATAAWRQGVVAALEPYTGRPWMDDFLVHLADRADSADEFVALIKTHPFLIKAMHKGASFPQILLALVSRTDFDAAFELAKLFTDADQSWEDMALTEDSTDPRLAPLTWQPVGNDNQIDARGNGMVAMALVIQPGVTTPLLRRYAQLAPGTYVLTTQLMLSSPARTHLHWSVKCAVAPLRPFASHRLPVTASALQRSSVRITIPEACPTQIWELEGGVTDSDAPSPLRIDSIHLGHRGQKA